jgi:hypothetical protein
MKRTILTLSTLMLATTAIAQPPGGGGPGGAAGLPDNETILANNDGNSDGEITKAEAEAAAVNLITNWDAFDADSDNKVTVAELDAYRASQGGAGAPGARAGGPPAAPPAAPAAPAPAAEDDEE